MDEDTCMVDMAKFFLEFTVDESCGKCAPCRIGTVRMLEILNKITSGNGEMEDLDRLEAVSYTHLDVYKRQPSYMAMETRLIISGENPS